MIVSAAGKSEQAEADASENEGVDEAERSGVRTRRPEGDSRAAAMKLPAAERAVVSPKKLRDYLLSTSHPVGRFKARFFASLGYTSEEWSRLESDLRGLVGSEDAISLEENQYGQKFEVRGKLKGPSGRSGVVVTVWIVLAGEHRPRFVTAYPGAKA